MLLAEKNISSGTPFSKLMQSALTVDEIGVETMGYIAPVTNYQYDQYAERVIIKKYDPYHFVPISTIKPPVNPRENFQHDLQPNTYNTMNLKKHQEKEKNKIIEKLCIAKLYGEITGIGRYYSDYA